MGTDIVAQNAILRELKDDDRAKVVKDGSIRHFELRETVYEAQQLIEEVYFPLDCVLSVVTLMRDGAMIEIGTIGHEGTTGIPLIMGGDTTANHAFCQVQGGAWRMSAATFRQLLAESGHFRDLVNRHLQAYLNMLGQFTACNRLHSVYERAARWILMTQDRVGSDTFPLTHEFLATMLGSRRSGVTIAAAILQKAGFIRYHRGRITVLDRAGLEATTCECYELTSRQFGDALRPSSSHSDTPPA
ncbi:MAG: Crp/Fnr family transcriptional regulator [Candidatus Baltobacteraceae bacterium]|jgi:CRP-like cAMP-binding protein